MTSFDPEFVEPQTALDRISSELMWGIAMLKFVLVAAFFFGFIAGPAAAKQEVDVSDITCSGTNLLAKLEKDDPATLARLRNEARKTINGENLFWKIEKPGVPASYLLGTMHFSDPRIVNLAAPIDAQLKAARAVIIETTAILDEDAQAKNFPIIRKLTMFTDGSTLEEMLEPNVIEALKKRLATGEVPYFMAKRMKPWVVSASLAMPACETMRKLRGAKMLDDRIGRHALDNNQELIGLETLEEQLGAMNGLPMDYQIKALSETALLGDQLDDMIETMVAMYQNQETALLYPLMEYYTPESAKGEGYEMFKDLLINNRNQHMHDRSLEHLNKGSVFMAVGALHLPGEKGLVNLFEKSGYKVTAVSLK